MSGASNGDAARDEKIKALEQEIAQHHAEAERLHRMAVDKMVMVSTLREPIRRSAAIAAKTRRHERIIALHENAEAKAATLLSDETVSRLASLLDIPATKIDDLKTLVRCGIAWEISWRDPELAPVRGTQISREDATSLVKAGKALSRVLKRLPAVREAVAVRVVVDRLVSNHVTRRGRPRQKDDCPRFSDFAKVFIGDTLEMGGRVTLNRKTGSGTLAAALAEMRPLFPPGFIPDPLPLKNLDDELQQTKKAVKKTAPKIAPDSWVVPPAREMRH